MITPHAILAPALPEGWVVKSSGWLCTITVRPRISGHAEAVSQHSHPCEAGQVRKQRRQVARVIGVRASGGIVVCSRAGKRVASVAGAGRALVDVQRKNGCAQAMRVTGQAAHGGCDQHALRRLVKRNGAFDASPGPGAACSTAAASGSRFWMTEAKYCELVCFMVDSLRKSSYAAAIALAKDAGMRYTKNQARKDMLGVVNYGLFA